MSHQMTESKNYQKKAISIYVGWGPVTTRVVDLRFKINFQVPSGLVEKHFQAVSASALRVAWLSWLFAT